METIKEYYDNGQLLYEDNYLNGKPYGIRKGWYKNGQLNHNKFFLIN